MSPGQDWCLQCGEGAPGSLGARSARWRPGAGILIATAILVLAAAGAGYAALSKGKGRTLDVTRTIAAATPATAPATSPAVTPTVPKNLGTPTTVKPPVPPTKVTPPKIPVASVTPKPATTTPARTTPTPPARTTPTSSTPTSAAPGETQQKAILLDTNAASTYNPYNHPVNNFGDPSLAIDGETATGWTAQVDPAVAPKMADGLAIDLKSARKLSALELITTTPGITVQAYGAAGSTLPRSITDPAWVKLSGSLIVKTRHFHIKLKSNAVRFVTLWISKAPAGSVGTRQAPGSVVVEGSAPGRVSVNEIELFP
jgi:hypothetical protein